MKKKILAALVCAALALTMTACAKEEGPNYISSKDKSSKSSVTESGNTPGDPENSGSGGASEPETSSTTDSKPEESKPDETSKPAGSGIDWDSVPYADELDFICEDYDPSIGYMGIKDNFKARYAGGVMITKYTGSEKLIKIPETIDGKPVVMLNGNTDYVFRSLSDTCVKIPKNLGFIFYGFSSCDNLTVDIPDYEAGTGEFYRTLYSGSFEWCSNLKLNMEPNSVGFFSGYNGVFCGCTFNGALVMPDSLTSIKYFLFFYNGTSAIDIGWSRPEACPEAIVYKGKTYDPEHFLAFIDIVNYDESGMKIEDGVLKGVSKATVGTLTVPDSVTSIGELAFFGCLDITEVIIPDSVTKIDKNTFRNSYSEFNVTYKGKTYKPNQLENLIKAVNGN